MPRPLPPGLLAAATAADAVPDAELLRRFARDRDPAAFELVARRHAPAVWAACRRILPDADAEDAFQAAFLVLARKAAAVRGPSAGGWLHRVAVTAALKLKAGRRREITGSPVEPGVASPDALERAELAAAVHEELARLPDRYRLPVVLCDLEGETQTAAAARLGWPVGSVAGRLSRARALLRDRLTRRGLAPAGSVLVLPLIAIPGRVVSAAVAAATGAVPTSIPVSLLASGVLSAMRTAKLKLAGVVLVAAGLVASAGVGAYTVAAQPLPAPREAGKAAGQPATGPAASGLKEVDGIRTAFPEITSPRDMKALQVECPTLFGADPVKDALGDDTLTQIRKEQLRALRLYLVRFQQRMEVAGQYVSADLLAYLQICADIREVAGDLWAKSAPREFEAWMADLIRHGKWIERLAIARVRAGTDSPQLQHMATAHRLAMEAALWKHRNPGKGP